MPEFNTLKIVNNLLGVTYHIRNIVFCEFFKGVIIGAMPLFLIFTEKFCIILDLFGEFTSFFPASFASLLCRSML